MAMLHNNGALATELARVSLESNIAFLGSSANISGTGVKFWVEDTQPEIVEGADLIVDYGLTKYHRYRVSSTTINFDSMHVIRIGCCYEVISDILKRYFDFECLPTPVPQSYPVVISRRLGHGLLGDVPQRIWCLTNVVMPCGIAAGPGPGSQ
jgi:hypothetical protein